MTTNTEHTQELTDKINESITALCAETDAAKQNETYRAWLDTLSRFYSYSFNNWLLICTQRPDATRVAGFQTWKSLGRFVKKGERGIRIFAPIIRKVEDENNGATELVSRPVGFRAIAVFALEQTDGDPLPEIDSNATEGGEELLPRLQAATASLGIQLVYKAIPGAAEGMSKGGLIEIEEMLSTAARCGVIVHELAHLCCVSNYVAVDVFNKLARFPVSPAQHNPSRMSGTRAGAVGYRLGYAAGTDLFPDCY